MNGYLHSSSALVIIRLMMLDTDFLMVYILFPFKYSLPGSYKFWEVLAYVPHSHSREQKYN